MFAKLAFYQLNCLPSPKLFYKLLKYLVCKHRSACVHACIYVNTCWEKAGTQKVHSSLYKTGLVFASLSRSSDLFAASDFEMAFANPLSSFVPVNSELVCE